MTCSSHHVNNVPNSSFNCLYTEFVILCLKYQLRALIVTSAKRQKNPPNTFLETPFLKFIFYFSKLRKAWREYDIRNQHFLIFIVATYPSYE